VKDVQKGVLADVTSGRGVTTSMAVWPVTGIVIVNLRVVKDVLVEHVNAGLENVHRVTTVIGAPNVINNAVMGVQQAHVVRLADNVHPVLMVSGETHVSSDVKVSV